jgi:hypothetical protein
MTWTACACEPPASKSPALHPRRKPRSKTGNWACLGRVEPPSYLRGMPGTSPDTSQAISSNATKNNANHKTSHHLLGRLLRQGMGASGHIGRQLSIPPLAQPASPSITTTTMRIPGRRLAHSARAYPPRAGGSRLNQNGRYDRERDPLVLCQPCAGGSRPFQIETAGTLTAPSRFEGRAPVVPPLLCTLASGPVGPPVRAAPLLFPISRSS